MSATANSRAAISDKKLPFGFQSIKNYTTYLSTNFFSERSACKRKQVGSRVALVRFGLVPQPAGYRFTRGYMAKTAFHF
jgi:hypothetical protein